MTGLVPSGPWLTGLAFAVVAVPFVVAARPAAAAPSAHLTLPDDLALIDLHTRRALAWKQQLGVFDHNNWNHPGPTYFYLLSLVYRVLGLGRPVAVRRGHPVERPGRRGLCGRGPAPDHARPGAVGGRVDLRARRRPGRRRPGVHHLLGVACSAPW